jgi:hypothetical protein
MNYLELAQKLRRKCRVSGTGPSAVTNQTEEYNRLLDWINEAYLEIQRMHVDWRFMRSSAWAVTVEGRQAYSATTDFGLTDFGYWALDFEAGDTFRNYPNPTVTISIAAPGVVSLAGHNLPAAANVKFGTDGALPTGLVAGTTYYVVNPSTDSFQVAATVGGTAITTTGTQSGTHTLASNSFGFIGMRGETFMECWDYDQWRDVYGFNAQRQTYTRPLVVAPGADESQLFCGPITDSGYTLLGDYYRVPTEMVNATDEPVIPDQFHWAIVYRAMMMYGVSEAAPEIFDEGEIAFTRIKLEMEKALLRRLVSAGALC